MDWTRGLHCPYNGRRVPSLELLKPTEELAYITSVVFGDGYVSEKEITIGLVAKDMKFVEQFSKRLVKVPGRGPFKPRDLQKENMLSESSLRRLSSS